ncbi:MAG: hypothetical protein JW873_03275 [Candidatus Saganbacteria bacterium]|nr:hypothetical protein [Candidatus Saganbacteria bacterium]
MKKLFCLSFLLILAIFWASCAMAADPYDLKVKTLYSAPDENTSVIYNIPIEVRLLDVSNDANWHKVRIAYRLGPLCYTYEGWVKIPVGELVAARTDKVAKNPAADPAE